MRKLATSSQTQFIIIYQITSRQKKQLCYLTAVRFEEKCFTSTFLLFLQKMR